MSINRKMTFCFVGIISFFLICCIMSTFFMFRKILFNKIISSQQAILYSNNNTLNFFFDSINHVCLQMVGDHLSGELLSATYEDFSLSQFRAHNSFARQFSQSTNVFFSGHNSTYTSVFYINDKIPLAKTFASQPFSADRQNIGGIFRDTQVKDAVWYKNAIAHNDRFEVFVNEGSNELFLAKRINNAYYTGPRLDDGIGVLLISFDKRQLETIFKLSKITENSIFLMISPENHLLYTNQQGAVPISEACMQNLVEQGRSTDYFKNGASHILDIEGEQYIVNLEQTKWGLWLLFLTPFSDVADQLTPVAHFIISCAVIIMLPCVLSIFLVSRAITRPIITLSQKMSSILDSRTVDPKDFQVRAKNEVGALYRSFSDLLDRNNRLIRDVQLRTIQQKEAELKALQAQINPHFVFNAMDVVNRIALSRNQDDIAEIVDTIASIMRYSITNPNDLVCLADELTNTKNYMKIQHLRYVNRLHLSVDVPPALLRLSIPKFIIQPLVENSILHGLRSPQSSISITICAQRTDRALVIRVSDNGQGCDVCKLNDFLAGLPTDLVVSNGFGVKNINERIHLKFPGESALSFENTPDGLFTAVISIVLLSRETGAAP